MHESCSVPSFLWSHPTYIKHMVTVKIQILVGIKPGTFRSLDVYHNRSTIELTWVFECVFVVLVCVCVCVLYCVVVYMIAFEVCMLLCVCVCTLVRVFMCACACVSVWEKESVCVNVRVKGLLSKVFYQIQKLYIYLIFNFYCLVLYGCCKNWGRSLTNIFGNKLVRFAKQFIILIVK